MSETRKILEMLSSGQINVEEAEGLLEALRDTDSFDKRVAVRTPKATSTGRLLKIDIHQSGEEDMNLNFQVPIESALVMENLIPNNIKKIIAARGFELDGLLVSLNPDFPKGKILDMHVSDDEYDTNILLEVTS
jgi:dephospho-CoA kinase